MTTASNGVSSRRWRTLLYVVLLVIGGGFTVLSFTRARALQQRFGDQLRADLDWRARHGPPEVAQLVGAGLARGDLATVSEILRGPAAAPDVRAVIVVNRAGQVVARQGWFEPTTALFAGAPQTLTAGAGYLTSWAPAEHDGQVVGKVAVVVSMARLAEARHELGGLSRNAIIAGVIRLLVGGLAIFGLTRAVMVRDRRLAEHAAHLERRVDERTRALADQTRALEEQTRALDQRNHGMRLVLDNVDQGLITIDLRGVMDPERSTIVDRWLGPPDRDTRFGDLVGQHCPDFAIWFELGLDGVREAAMPVEVVLSQLPGRFTIGAQVFEVVYSPILDGGQVTRLLLIVTDVTVRVARERAERAERELLVLFERLTHDRTGFEEFVDETSELVVSLERLLDPITERRVVHTLKGNCRLYGIEGYAELCHTVEGELAELRAHAPLSPDQRARLRTGWREVLGRVARLLGDRTRPVVEVERRELIAVIDRARQGGSGRDLLAVLSSWSHERVSRRFERLGEHAQQLASKLGKGDLDVAIRDGGLRLDTTRWAPFWRGLIHAVRNAVDHGVEPEAERLAAGKPARALMSLSASLERGALRIAIGDDGRGIDWDQIRARVADAGVACVTTADLEAALFVDGVTTRDQATATSGRGVGLAALRQAVLDLDGTIEVESRLGIGTTLTFVFPADPGIVPLRPPSQPIRRIA